mmetsp:Transcript_9659/g.23778  ORF Transcript_9659/g.23778 Transcript_9659/m.23778 type:complete len:507 (-) Transcript_9659:959-2479(-)
MRNIQGVHPVPKGVPERVHVFAEGLSDPVPDRDRARRRDAAAPLRLQEERVVQLLPPRAVGREERAVVDAEPRAPHWQPDREAAAVLHLDGGRHVRSVLVPDDSVRDQREPESLVPRDQAVRPAGGVGTDRALELEPPLDGAHCVRHHFQFHRVRGRLRRRKVPQQRVQPVLGVRAAHRPRRAGDVDLLHVQQPDPRAFPHERGQHEQLAALCDDDPGDPSAGVFERRREVPELLVHAPQRCALRGPRGRVRLRRGREQGGAAGRHGGTGHSLDVRGGFHGRREPRRGSCGGCSSRPGGRRKTRQDETGEPECGDAAAETGGPHGGVHEGRHGEEPAGVAHAFAEKNGPRNWDLGRGGHVGARRDGPRGTFSDRGEHARGDDRDEDRLYHERREPEAVGALAVPGQSAFVRRPTKAAGGRHTPAAVRAEHAAGCFHARVPEDVRGHVEREGRGGSGDPGRRALLLLVGGCIGLALPAYAAHRRCGEESPWPGLPELCAAGDSAAPR